MRRSRIDGRDYPNTLKLEAARQLRQSPTPAERHAWSILRRKGILGLILELDGYLHGAPDQASYDSARTAWLETHGYVVVRVRNRDVGRDALEQMLKTYLPL